MLSYHELSVLENKAAIASSEGLLPLAVGTVPSPLPLDGGAEAPSCLHPTPGAASGTLWRCQNCQLWDRPGFAWAPLSVPWGFGVTTSGGGEHGVRCCPPPRLLHCPPGAWLGEALLETGVGHRAGGGLGTCGGFAPPVAHRAPFRPAFRSRASCAREGTPVGPRLCV